MVSRLEAALSLAMVALLVSALAGWETGSRVAGVLFLALVISFTARLIYRRRRGQSWDEAWGRAPNGRR